MSAVALNNFGEIDRFNAYVRDNTATAAQLLADIKGLADIVKVANDLKFTFSLEDVQSYIREQAKTQLTEEQLAMITGGGCVTSFTFSYTAAWTLAHVAIQVEAIAEIGVAAIVVAVAVVV